MNQCPKVRYPINEEFKTNYDVIPFGILGSVEGLQTLGPDPTSPC